MRDSAPHDGTDPVTHRRVLGLAIPIMLSNLSVPLVGVVDTAVMGRLPGATQIGAVALGATVFAFLFWGFGFLRMGTTGLVAQAFGRRSASELRTLVLTLSVSALALGSVIVVLHQPIGMIARWALPASSAVESSMTTYYDIRVWSAPAVLFNYVLMGVFIGMQRTGLALIAQLTLNLSNAALSLWWVLVLDAGIAGVAWASLCAELLAMAVGVVALGAVLRDWPSPWPWRVLGAWQSYARLFRVNGDIFIRTFCLIFGFAWFNAQSAVQGEMRLAANAVLLQLVHVLAYGLDGFAHAAESLVGEARGALRRLAYQDAIRIATQWAAGVALLYAVAYFMWGPSIVAFLSTDADVRATAASYLPWVWIAPIVSVWCYLLDGIFVGTLRTADMRNAMLLSTALFLALSYPLMAAWQNHGLWAALLMFFIFRAITLGGLLWKKPLDWDSNGAKAHS